MFDTHLADTSGMSRDNRYIAYDRAVLLTGVQAMIRIPLDQLRADRRHDLRTAAFISGYPGSPLGAFDRELHAARTICENLGVRHQPGHNEELAATAVMGSQIVDTFARRRNDGIIGIWYGKAPGLDRAMDAFRHAQYAGTARQGGVLAYVGDDPANKSSTLPSSSASTLAALGIPVLEPGTVQDILDLGRHGIAMSRRCGLWTAIRVVTSVADAVGSAIVQSSHVLSPVETHENSDLTRTAPIGVLLPPATTRLEREVAESRLELARHYLVQHNLNIITVHPSDAVVGIVAVGQAYHETISSLDALGLDHKSLARLGVRLLHIRMAHPLDSEIFLRFAKDLREIIVIEEKHALVENYLFRVLYRSSDPPIIVGKRDEKNLPLIPIDGRLTASRLTGLISARLRNYLPNIPQSIQQAPLQLLPLSVVKKQERTPYVCSGCPHSVSSKVPADSVVGAAIGCSSLAQMYGPEANPAPALATQMGAEGAAWIGIEPFVGDGHLFQSMGDGTYFHSGQLAIQAAIAAGSHITFKLLYNSAIAMTGGQPLSMSNGRPVADLATVLVKQGVSRVVVTTDDTRRYKGIKLPRGVDVWPRERILQAQQVLEQAPGVSVLIHDQQCAVEGRRQKKRDPPSSTETKIVINERICEGCGDCGVKSNCLSVEPIDTEFGRKTRINQTSCNTDLTCTTGDCPSFLIVRPGRPTPSSYIDQLDLAGLKDPSTDRSPDAITIRMPGIGGTGVVTASHILATAALLSGFYVSGLDQTGLSQKAGPVVSDLRITTPPSQAANIAQDDSVDLYLVFDQRVALGRQSIDGVQPGYTSAVVSTSNSPTGQEVTNSDLPVPPAYAMLAELERLLGEDRVVAVDAAAVTSGLFRTAVYANIFLLGVAYQYGYLPFQSDAISRAIELNNVDVRLNKLAFQAGRLWVHDPARLCFEPRPLRKVGHAGLKASRGLLAEVPAGLQFGDVGEILHKRVDDLIRYQDRRYARRYLSTVSLAYAAERRVDPVSTRFTETVAHYLHKLMAYKDEYEVARLHLEASGPAATAAVGPHATYSLLVHPPLLRSIGLRRKIALGPWSTPLMRLLRACRHIRGRWFDPFGHTVIRRQERSLISEYERQVKAAGQGINDAGLDTAVRLAALPEIVRGYEHIKMRNIGLFRREMAKLSHQLRLDDHAS